MKAEHEEGRYKYLSVRYGAIKFLSISYCGENYDVIFNCAGKEVELNTYLNGSIVVSRRYPHSYVMRHILGSEYKPAAFLSDMLTDYYHAKELAESYVNDEH